MEDPIFWDGSERFCNDPHHPPPLFLLLNQEYETLY